LGFFFYSLFEVRSFCKGICRKTVFVFPPQKKHFVQLFSGFRICGCMKPYSFSYIFPQMQKKQTIEYKDKVSSIHPPGKFAAHSLLETLHRRALPGRDYWRSTFFPKKKQSVSRQSHKHARNSPAHPLELFHFK